MSRPRRLMALDTTTYKLLVLKELSRSKQLPRSKRLPSIFSAVLYTGEKKWRAKSSLLELVKEVSGAPEGLSLWSFKLIDLHRYPIEEWGELKSPLKSLFRLERLRDVGGLPELALELKAALPPEDQDLADAFVELINEIVLRRLTPEGATQIRITDLEEIPSMLAQRIDKITHGWKMQGWEEGHEAGHKEGRSSGLLEEAAHMFLELFATKHGTVSDEVRGRVGSASKQQLETWAKRLLKTDDPADVFVD